MEKSSFRHSWFIWLALTMLGTLLVYPATRHLFYTQSRMEIGAYSIDTDAALEGTAAANLPGDYPVQLAHAEENPTASLWTEFDFGSDRKAKDPLPEMLARNQRIEALTRRFSNNPSVYANFLRYMAVGEVYARRDDDGSRADTSADKQTHSVSPEALERYQDAVQRGRRLDPDNAYFPMMQAVGLFVAHRDREALDALKTAGRCSRWNAYFQDSLDGLNRLQYAAYGDRGAIQRLFNFGGQSFLPYARWKATVRVAIHLARDQELAGNTQEAIAIRHAVMRCGGLMRSQGASFLSVMVGIAITNIATVDPGGMPNPESLLSPQSHQETPQQREERRNRYYAYLERNGHRQEAVWAKAEIAQGDRALTIIHEVGTRHGEFGRYFFDLSCCWLDNLALLVSALVLLILGVTAYLAGVLRPKRFLPMWRSAFLFSIVVGIGLWQWRALSSVHPYLLLQYMTSYLIGDGVDGKASAAGVQGLAAVLILLTPILFVGLIAALSLFLRVPLATGLGRGLRALALPAAAGMVLIYGLSLLPTAYTESALDTAVAKSVQNQPHFLAESIHEVWPGEPQP